MFINKLCTTRNQEGLLLLLNKNRLVFEETIFMLSFRLNNPIGPGQIPLQSRSLTERLHSSSCLGLMSSVSAMMQNVALSIQLLLDFCSCLDHASHAFRSLDEANGLAL